MYKQLFYFGDLDFLLKQEYFKDKLNYEHFLEFVEKLKNKELETNQVTQLQYKNLTGVNISILLSKTINGYTDYVCYIDQLQHLTIKNHNFFEIECNIKSTSGLFGLLCVSSAIDNVERLIQDISKEHNALVFSINSDEDNLDYHIRTFDVNEEAYCQSCNQYEHDDIFAQRSCNCNCNHSVILNNYQVYAHEIGLNNKRLFVFSS